MYINLKYILISACLTMSTLSFAQQLDNSPFSSFGVGIIHPDNTAFFEGIGGLGASFLDPYHLNLQNPASFSFLRSTAFEIGMSAKYAEITDAKTSSTQWIGNLDYIALGFPLKNPINAALERVDRDITLGMSLFMKPHSNVGYNINSTVQDPVVGNHVKNFEGNGGTFKFMWGNSLKYKNLSFGANIGYLFGNLIFDQNIFFTSTEYNLENRYSLDYNVNGFIWDAGVAYNLLLNKDEVEKNKNTAKRILNLGIYGNSAQKFQTISNLTQISNFEAANITDTLSSLTGVKGTGRLPAEIGLGLTYFNDVDYAIGVNFDYGAWSGYENSIRNETLSNTFRFSIGGLYRPDAKSYNSYFKRVAYKAGLFYQKDPQIIENTQITDTGVNLGATFPFIYQRKISHVNAAFRFGLKGNGTPIQELYGKISLGFTFNDDQWFIKRKYN